MQVAVIGAGIVGSAVARELAKRGAEVTVFEQSRPGAGTSGRTFAWINSHDKRPDSYHRLNIAGCEEHQRLAADPHHVPSWYACEGNLEWADATQQRRLDDRMRRLGDAGYPCRWIDTAEATRLEPDLRVDAHDRSIAYFPEEAYVQPTLLLARLLGEAHDHGTQVHCPVRVHSLEPASSGVDVVLASGERQRFDKVVSCAGRWSEGLAASSGIDVPLVDPCEAGGAAVGFLAYTAPVPVRLSRVLTTPRINVRPDGGGRLVLQGLDLDAHADPARPPEPGIADALASRLGEVLSVDGPVSIDSVGVGQRALPGDGLTVAGFDQETGDRLYVVVTHSGVTLGPLLGRLVASEVLGTDESQMLGDFRPGRFAGSEPTPQIGAARLPGEQ